MNFADAARILVIAGEEADLAEIRGQLDDLGGVTSIVIAADLSRAIEDVTVLRPDVILLAIGATRPLSLESISLLAECVPDIPVVVLGAGESANSTSAAIQEGAHDVLNCADLSSEQLSRSIRSAIETARARGQALRSNARFRRLYENAIAGIFSVNGYGDFLSANPAALEMLGFASESELLHNNLVSDICINADHGQELLRILRREGSIRNAELAMHSRRQKMTTALLCATTVLDRQGEVEFIEGTMIDISERKKAQDELMYLAKFDRLTGLANRYLFRETVAKTIARALRRHSLVALLLIDLDRFKEINDTLGHDAGDSLLRAVGSRLARCTREGDTVARLGGDEFAVLIEAKQNGTDDIAVVAQKVQGQLAQAYSLSGHEVYATPSIGIAVCPDSGTHSETLMKAADIAMYRAKAEGRNRFVFYSQDIHDEVMAKLALEHELRTACETNDFTLAYQPKVSLEDGAIVGFEALLRWHSETLGFVSPVRFIPVLERTGLLNRVGRWVMFTAAKQLAVWQRELGMPDLAMSVNLSVRQLHQHQLLLDDISASVGQANIRPECLEFEVTESTLMHDTDLCIQTLESMRDLGVGISIDDFGTGFSSLQYLKRLPIRGLKIDRMFVSDIPKNRNDVAIVRATLAMAQSLGLVVTAEGVETREQAEFLREAGCGLAQGYFFSRPQPPEAIPALLQMEAAQLPGYAETQAEAARSEAALPQPAELVPESSDAEDDTAAATEHTVSVLSPFHSSSRSRH